MEPRPTRQQSVYDHLRERILAGDFAPGAPLVASHLAAAVGASRTPVREALLRLVAEGLVAGTPGGAVVRQLTEEEIVETYEVRVPLEGAAARLAALNRTALGLAQIQAAQGRLVTATRQEPTDYAAIAVINIEFHHAICKAARNTLLLDLISRTYDRVGRFKRTTFSYAGRLREALAEHDAIVGAVVERDPDRAERLAKEHMQHALDVRLKVFREQQVAGP